MMSSDGVEFRFFCLVHGQGFKSVRQTRIYCERGNHELKADFPYGGKWTYCLNCMRFYSVDADAAGMFPSPHCLACSREIEKRYLCPECFTFYTEAKKESGIKYQIDDSGRAFNCLACRKTSSGLAINLHKCAALKVEFYSALIDCPFCKTSIYEEEFHNLRKTVAELKDIVWYVSAQISRLKQEKINSRNDSSGESKINFILTQVVSDFDAKLDEKMSALENRLFQTLHELKEKITKNIRAQDVLLDTNNKEFSHLLRELSKRVQTIENQVKQNSAVRPGTGETYAQTAATTDLPRSFFAFPDKIMSLLDKAAQKFPKVQYPLLSDALKQASNNEKPTFYVIAEMLAGEIKSYAVPSYPRIFRETEFSIYTAFYDTENRTFSGEIEIVEPAEVAWDESIKGWRLRRRGRIRFV
jgi:hypothetical protein